MGRDLRGSFRPRFASSRHGCNPPERGWHEITRRRCADQQQRQRTRAAAVRRMPEVHRADDAGSASMSMRRPLTCSSHPGSCPTDRAQLGYHLHASLSQLMYAGIFVDLPVSANQRQGGAELMYYLGDIAELLLVFALVTTWRRRRRASSAQAERAGVLRCPSKGVGAYPTPCAVLGLARRAADS
jgi:hypothetical protein